jgi:hypothetical protein
MNQSHFTGMLTDVRRWLYSGSIALVASLSGCADDPSPVNEEELITTVIVELTPLTGGGNTIILQYYDEDGIGSISPIKTISGGPLAANQEYTGEVTFLNETESPAEDITEEIKAETNDHLLCYSITGLIGEIQSIDSDGNAKPIGLTTLWSMGAASAGNVKITLRHQPGTKSGVCPGTGDTDIEVDFDLVVQ